MTHRIKRIAKTLQLVLITQYVSQVYGTVSGFDQFTAHHLLQQQDIHGVVGHVVGDSVAPVITIVNLPGKPLEFPTVHLLADILPKPRFFQASWVGQTGTEIRTSPGGSSIS